MFLNSLTNIPDISQMSGNISKVLNVIFGVMQSSDGTSQFISETVTNSITQVTESYSFVLAIIGLIFGVLGCFFGYRLSRLFMALSGFLAGLVIGTLVGARILNGSNLVVILCALGFGLVLSAFSYKIYQAGIFVLCFFLAFVAAANFVPFTGNVAFFLCTLCGFVVGSLALKFVRPVVILSSAIVCAHKVSESLMLLGPHFKVGFFSHPYAAQITFIGFAILGILIQFLTSRETKKK